MTSQPQPKVNILLIGGGGREHALALAIKRSKLLGTLFASHTTNPGIASLAKAVDVPVSIREVYRLQDFVQKNQIGLVVIGPEEPLAEGFADKLASPTCKVFGPTKDGARLEADKGWAKQFMRSASIPTPDARLCTDAESARSYLESKVREEPLLEVLLQDAAGYRDSEQRRKFLDGARALRKDIAAIYDKPRNALPVIKAVGLAKGKGVVLPKSLSEALAVIDEIMVRKIHGEAGKHVLIEERLEGVEVSVLAVTDGQTLAVLPPAQDHKRLLDHDEGPNTGGMGAFCPAATIDAPTMARIEREILIPALDALKREGIAYKGVLYAGLMLTHSGPKVLEFNCRLGDPECQAILPRLMSDIVELMLAACDGTLDRIDIAWHDHAACCVVLASKGYPQEPKPGAAITGIEDAEKLPGVTVYHAGTKRVSGGDIVVAGGRVLSVTATGATMAEARSRAYAGAKEIRFDGLQMRTDIAREFPPGAGPVRLR